MSMPMELAQGTEEPRSAPQSRADVKASASVKDNLSSIRPSPDKGPSPNLAGPIPTSTGQEGPTDVYKRIKWNGWGTLNKWMRVSPEDPLMIIHANGKKMPSLMAFAHQQINGGVGEVRPLERTPCIPIEEAIAKLPQQVLNQPFLDQLLGKSEARANDALQTHQIKMDGEARLCHIFGKNYRDLWRVRRAEFERAPDIVLLPQCHDDVVRIMRAAVEHNVVLVPFGGGTNVTGGIEASPFEARRCIASVDMRRMGRMLSIDTTSRIATFEAGVLGPDLDEALGRHGFMFGHDPDSYIHSTLGGWVATRSSGAMSNQYGDIENMTLALRMVTPSGVISTPLTSRPCGPDLNGILIGSEGHFGIITEVTVKIEPIPDVRHYEGWMFPRFEDAYEAFYECTRRGVHPAAMRLYDEDDTRMSLALKTETSMAKSLIGRAVKHFLVKIKGWSPETICLVIVGHEGSKEHVTSERRRTAAIFKRHGGFCLGRGAGEGWQEKKYDLPFVRDFALNHKLWADVFETSVLYKDAIACWRDVKAAVRDVWRSEGKKGWIGCHAAHQYRFGCCLYFTYAGQQFDERDFETFLKIKVAATNVMLKHRGNLTHHHGIGYEHVPWVERYMGSPAMELLLALKRTLDPQDICNPHKLLPVQRREGESDDDIAKRRREMMMFYRMGLPKGSKVAAKL